MTQSSYQKITSGGVTGHVLRRFVHLLVGPLVSWLYFYHSTLLLQWSTLSSKEFSVGLFGLIAVVDVARIHFAFVPLGMRDFECRQISSAAWAMFGLCLIFLFLNKPNYAFPIIVSAALVDPIIGELKRMGLIQFAYYLGGVAAFSIWLVFAWYFDYSAWLAVLLAPVTVLSEWCAKRYFDDNFTMLVFPLVVVLLVRCC